MMEQQFARFLLDRIDEEVNSVPEASAQRIRLHLKELRNVVDTALETSGSARGKGKGGNANA